MSVSTVELTEVESAKAGDTVEVKYTVTGGTVAPKELDFEIESGATSEHTAFIPGSNRLVLGLDEKGTTINVKATSRYNKTVTATTTVTVS